MRKRKNRRYFRPDARSNGRMVDTGLYFCESPHCPRKVNRKRERNVICWKCRWRRWKEKNPLRYAFGNLHRRAKQRGKIFLLTFEQYRRFAESTDYARLKGKTSLSLSIDRKDNDGPYASWNIAAISLRENSRKQYVPFFGRQLENQNYQLSSEELAAKQAEMSQTL